MRLTELNPRWCAVVGRHGQGVTFDCPHCRKARLVVFFANPLDGDGRLPLKKYGLELYETEHDLSPKGTEVVPAGFHWERTGDSFETLTLTPSVDASASGHWHGHVRDGQCVGGGIE